MNTLNIGAPNSIARYVANSDWGNNKFAVFARSYGELVLVAAQSTLAGALRYCTGERQLVDIENVRILDVPKGCGKATRVDGTNGGFMACGACLTNLDQTVTVEFCPACAPSLP